MPFDARGQFVRDRQEPSDVNPVRVVAVARWHGRRMVRVGRGLGLGLVRTDPLGSPAEQRDGAARVASVRVRQPDRNLGESLP